jgi:very-short-patch-repair endonuclease
MTSKSPITEQTPGKKEVSLSKQFRKVMTPPERKMWGLLRNNQLGGLHFRRQQIIGPYIVDFYCHQARLVIEIDGEIHGLHQESDLRRDQYLQSEGFEVMRLSARDVMQDPSTALEVILIRCRELISAPKRKAT